MKLRCEREMQYNFWAKEICDDDTQALKLSHNPKMWALELDSQLDQTFAHSTCCSNTLKLLSYSFTPSDKQSGKHLKASSQTQKNNTRRISA